MLNFEFKYKDIKPYSKTFNKTNKLDGKLLSEFHLDGIKQIPIKPKQAIKYEFPSHSYKRGVSKYDLDFVGRPLPYFRYRPEDIVEVDENEILDNFHQDKATVNVEFSSIKPMNFKDTQINNMREELGIANPLSALRAEAVDNIPLNEYENLHQNLASAEFKSQIDEMIKSKYLDPEGEAKMRDIMSKTHKDFVKKPKLLTDVNYRINHEKEVETIEQHHKIIPASKILQHPTIRKVDGVNSLPVDVEALNEFEKTKQEQSEVQDVLNNMVDKVVRVEKKKALKQTATEIEQALKNKLIQKEESSKMMENDVDTGGKIETEPNLKVRAEELAINIPQSIINIPAVNKLYDDMLNEENPKEKEKKANQLNKIVLDIIQYSPVIEQYKQYTEDTYPAGKQERGDIQKVLNSLRKIVKLEPLGGNLSWERFKNAIDNEELTIMFNPNEQTNK